jgi:cytochrome c
MHKLLISLAVTLAFGSVTALAETPGLGKSISEADIKAWDIAVLPDGTNLPPGSGTPAQGAPITRRSAPCESGITRNLATHP